LKASRLRSRCPLAFAAQALFPPSLPKGHSSMIVAMICLPFWPVMRTHSPQ